MSLRVILARLNGTPTDKDVLRDALAISDMFRTHTVALFSRPEPHSEGIIIDEGISAADYEDLMVDIRREWKEFELNAFHTFEKWRTHNEIPFVQNPSWGPGPSAEWIVPADLASEARNIARFGRAADILISAASAMRADDVGLEAALFHTGRPVLLAPDYSGADIHPGTVIIAWNGSVEASHAVAASMPLLVRAEHVMAFTMPKGDLRNDAAWELVRYLIWHGVPASVLRAEAGGANSVSGALLEAVEKVKANLLVMGAYTHSRVREQFFGGVTRDVLKNANVAVLMAH